MNKNNKIIWGIFVLVSVVAFASLYYFFYCQKYDFGLDYFNKDIKKQDPYLIDQNKYGEAVTNQDISLCDNVKDLVMKNTCIKEVAEIKQFNNSVIVFDPLKCESLSDGDKKQSCLSVAKSGVEYLEKNDTRYLAEIYLASNNAKGIEMLDKVLSSNPDDVETLNFLALSYAEKALKSQEMDKDRMAELKKAQEYIERSKKINSQNSETFRVEAYINEIVPEYMKAISLYDKSIELDNGNILAYVGRAHTNNLIGALDKAIEDLEKASEIDKDKMVIAIYSNICRLASSNKDLTEKAIKNCKIVTENKNKVEVVSISQAHQILSTIYMREDQFDKAEQELLAAKSYTPQDANLYLTMATLALQKEEADKILENAKSALSLNPTKSTAYYLLSRGYYIKQSFDEAIKSAEQGIGLVDKDVSLLISGKDSLKRDFYFIMADAYKQKGDTVNELKNKELGDAAINSTNE